MRAGRLRHRITLQKPAGTRDAVGERTTTWSNVVSSWPAAIEPLRVQELVGISQFQSRITHRIMLRYSTEIESIDHSWRVLFGLRVFVIEGVRNIDERNRELELLCSEGLREE